MNDNDGFDETMAAARAAEEWTKDIPKKPVQPDPTAPAQPPALPDPGSHRGALIAVLVGGVLIVGLLYLIGAFGRG